jgi:hypothetical protein
MQYKKIFLFLVVALIIAYISYVIYQIVDSVVKIKAQEKAKDLVLGQGEEVEMSLCNRVSQPQRPTFSGDHLEAWQTFDSKIETNIPVFYPYHETELKTILAKAKKGGCKVRVSAGSNSPGSLVVDTDNEKVIIINLKNFRSELDEWKPALDNETGVATVYSHLSLLKVMALFRHRGFTLYSAPANPFITIGGLVNSFVHGNAHNHGEINTDIEALYVMNHEGETKVIGKKQELELFMGSFGKFGIVLAAKLKLKPDSGLTKVKILKYDFGKKVTKAMVHKFMDTVKRNYDASRWYYNPRTNSVHISAYYMDSFARRPQNEKIQPRKQREQRIKNIKPQNAILSPLQKSRLYEIYRSENELAAYETNNEDGLKAFVTPTNVEEAKMMLHLAIIGAHKRAFITEKTANDGFLRDIISFPDETHQEQLTRLRLGNLDHVFPVRHETSDLPVRTIKRIFPEDRVFEAIEAYKNAVEELDYNNNFVTLPLVMNFYHVPARSVKSAFSRGSYMMLSASAFVPHHQSMTKTQREIAILGSIQLQTIETHWNKVGKYYIYPSSTFAWNSIEKKRDTNQKDKLDVMLPAIFVQDRASKNAIASYFLPLEPFVQDNYELFTKEYLDQQEDFRLKVDPNGMFNAGGDQRKPELKLEGQNCSAFGDIECESQCCDTEKLDQELIKCLETGLANGESCNKNCQCESGKCGYSFLKNRYACY